MAIKIFVGNYKGGVGKTTSVFQISYYLTQLQVDKKVLMIDLDPQCSLSEICMKEKGEDLENLENLEVDECLNYILDMYMKKFRKYNQIDIQPNLKKLIKKKYDNVDFIPSNLFHKNKERGLDTITCDLQKYDDSIFILNQFILDSKLDDIYDYIIFDCPPTNNIITQGAFLLSDYYLIPTIMDTISTKGIRQYISSVDKIYNNICVKHEDAEIMKAVFKEKPRLLGIFETLYKAKTENEEIIGRLEKECSETEDLYIFKNKIYNYIDIARATSEGEQSRKTEKYKELTLEILYRISSCQGK